MNLVKIFVIFNFVFDIVDYLREVEDVEMWDIVVWGNILLNRV